MYNNLKPETKEQEVEAVAETVAENPAEFVEPIVEVQMAIEEIAEPEILAPVEEPKQPDILSAIVVDCAKLNVREEPSPRANVVAIIDASNEVVVYDSESFGNYYKVCTASGIEGYCIKDYLKLK
jgi:uncharacterized protein YgiM (DUF1202 family)